MSRLDQAFERLLLAMARRSGRIVAAVSLLLYPGVALVVPLLFGWPPPWLIVANLFGASMAALVVLTWIAVKVQARDRRHLVDWTSDLCRLDAAEFESFVGEAFRRDGWNVEETGSHDGPDGNIDLVLRKNNIRRVVQCKPWTSWMVGVDEVRAFAGTLAREGMPTTGGILVTLSGFTDQARREARTLATTLVDGPDLYSLAERVRRTEPCPTCRAPMLLGRLSHGWRFRCVRPSCVGKRDLGSDPVRAVEFLTEPPMTGRG